MIREPNTIEMLVNHEAAIKELYDLFGAMFSEQKAFWQGIADDEQRHSNILKELAARESLKGWFLNDRQFQQLAINNAIDYIEQQREDAKKSRISLLEALSIAIDIEEALIEKQFIRLNISGPEEIRTVMRELVADTQRHRKMINEKLNFLKQGRQ